jgi:hypothetical protein
LLTHGEPPIIIYEEDKDRYYDALEKYNSDEQIQPMHIFFAYETEKTWKATFERNIRNESKEREKLDDFTV